MEAFESWNDLKGYLESTFGTLPGMNVDFLRFPYRRESNMATMGAFRITMDDGGEWVAFAVKICPIDSIRPLSALLKNAELPVGSFSVVMDTLTLRQSLPIKWLTVSRVHHVLDQLLLRSREVLAAQAHPDDEDNPFAYLLR